jgi:hypothetical protein
VEVGWFACSRRHTTYRMLFLDIKLEVDSARTSGGHTKL